MEGDRGLWEILVPVVSNDGLEYDESVHLDWNEKVAKIAGGITIFEKVKGYWENSEGVILIEEIIPVRICCDRKTIDSIVKLTLGYYNQESVMAYKVSSEVILKYRELV